jgi:hydroxypyruvate reductase/glycerate 2-kinase
MREMPSPQAQKYREDARAIWWAGVEAVQPRRCLDEHFHGFGVPVESLAQYDRILVVGGGKAGAAMAEALEHLLERHDVPLSKVSGLVNVPNETVIPLKAIKLHPARPMGINQPTEAALAGTNEILRIAESAGPNDVMLCLISGGGSALLPAPVPGVSLVDKQQVTKFLHECGATIQEMNAVRKHLSRIKGGGLVRHFRGAKIYSLIISDVIGDPLDAIASGPTAVDPTTFAEATAILRKFGITAQLPIAVISHLQEGERGEAPETLKELPTDKKGEPLVRNLIVANLRRAIGVADHKASCLGYLPMTGRSNEEGDTTVVANAAATIMKTRARVAGKAQGLCLIGGGETTVMLGPNHGLGGRNQEYVLAFLNKLGVDGMKNITVLSGGTDGEDGPTDAAGAIGDAELVTEASVRGLDPADYLARHDAYHFFEPLGGLLKTGPTNTNVMDLRVILIHPD